MEIVDCRSGFNHFYHYFIYLSIYLSAVGCRDDNDDDNNTNKMTLIEFNLKFILIFAAGNTKRELNRI